MSVRGVSSTTDLYKNGWLPCGQEGIDGRSQWGTGMRETEVRLDGWCECGLRQHRNDGGGCATMKTGKSGEPWYLRNWMSFTWPILLGPVFFRTSLPCSGGYHMERGGMPLQDVFGINFKKVATTENQGSAVKYMGYGVHLFYLTWHDYPSLV